MISVGQASLGVLLLAATVLVAIPSATAGGDTPGPIGHLDYKGGPVQHDPTFYAIFWLPSGQTFEPSIINGDTGYANLMNRYLGDIHQSNWANVAAQYYDTTSGYTNPIGTASQFGGYVVDTTAYPRGGTAGDPLLQDDIVARIKADIVAQGWTDGVNSTFFVFTPRNVEDCFPSTGTGGAVTGGNCTPNVQTEPYTSQAPITKYCGYHDATKDANNNDIVYAVLPEVEAYNSDVLAEECSYTNALPNGDVYADNEFSVVSHEQFEAETDPLLTGWKDGNGFEIGDQCQGQWGHEPYFGPSNVDVNGDKYEIQEEWDNINGACGGSINGEHGYQVRYGPFIAFAGQGTPTLDLALTSQVPSVNIALAPNPTIDWGDGTTSEASSDEYCVVDCVYHMLSGSHTYSYDSSTNYPVQEDVKVTYHTGCCISYDQHVTVMVFAPTPFATNTGVTSHDNPSQVGEQVTYFGAWGPISGDNPAAGGTTGGGTLTFKDGDATIPGCVSTIGADPIGTCQVTYDQPGQHNVTAVFSGNAFYSGSTSSPVIQTVEKTAQTITGASAAPSSPAVGDTYTPTAQGGGSNNPVTISVDSSASGNDCSITAGVVSFDAVGPCIIDFLQAGNDTFADASPVEQVMNVVKGSQAIQFTSTAPAHPAYGGTYTPTAVGGGSTSPVVFSISASSSGFCSIAAGVVSFDAVGLCTIDADQAGDANYLPAVQATQSFTIGKASQAVSFSSNPSNPTYGGHYTPTATGGGSTNPVVITVDSSTALDCTISGGKVSFIGVGPCTLDASQAGDARYSAGSASQTFDIGSAALSVQAADGSMSYGGTPPVITPQYHGFVNGDNAQSLTTVPTCVSGATPGFAAGTYEATTTCSGATDPNYSFTYRSGTLTVNPAPLVITASNGVMTYGGTQAVITAFYDGFENGDTVASLATQPSCATSGSSVTPAGTHKGETACAGAFDSNYVISYVPGDLTVNKAPLAVAASDGTMTYGGTLPTITPRYGGFVNGDGPGSLNSPPTCGSTATATVPPGTYSGSTSCSGLVDDNYQANYVNGTLTVLPTPLTITASSPSMVYGSTPPAITPSYGGFVNGDQPSSLTGAHRSPPTCTSSVTSTTDVGSYPTSCSGAASPNYSISYVNGVEKVTQAYTSTALSSSPNPSVYGTPVSLTATVAVTSPGGGTPTGAVTFFDGSNPVGIALVLHGSASLTTTSLSGGPHQLSAQYGGNLDFVASTSPLVTQTVQPAATSLSATPALSGGFVPSASLTRSDNHQPVAGQTVDFSAGGIFLCSAVTNASGVATCRTSYPLNMLLALGYSASYSATANYQGSRARTGL